MTPAQIAKLKPSQRQQLLCDAWHGPQTIAEVAVLFKLTDRGVRKAWERFRAEGRLPGFAARPHFIDETESEQASVNTLGPDPLLCALYREHGCDERRQHDIVIEKRKPASVAVATMTAQRLAAAGRATPATRSPGFDDVCGSPAEIAS